MKKNRFVLSAVVCLILLLFSCKKTIDPSLPQGSLPADSATATPTAFISATADFTPTNTETAYFTHTATATVTKTQTAGISPTITCTNTITMTFNATEIIEAALTVVAVEQTVVAVKTAEAQQTAAAQQTAVKAMTVVAQLTVSAQQTAAASQTQVALQTVVAAALTAVASQTAVARQTEIAQQTIVAAQTMVVAVQTIEAANTALASCTNREIASVPAGTYIQHDIIGNSLFTHSITLPYELGKYEVTYELWFHVRNWGVANGYVFANPGREGYNGVDGADPTTRKLEPVTRVNWRNAIVWCNAYSEMTGLTPVYYSDPAMTVVLKSASIDASIDSTPGSEDNPYVAWDVNGYRLPTEGEWELAARYIDGSSWQPYDYASGSETDYTDVTKTSEVAWFFTNSGAVTHNVGTLLPNALNINDMSGNVLEWCWDWNTDYPSAVQVDYKGAASGTYRIRRGGSYRGTALVNTTGFRNWNDPFLQVNLHGFRVARSAP